LEQKKVRQEGEMSRPTTLLVTEDSSGRRIDHLCFKQGRSSVRIADQEKEGVIDSQGQGRGFASGWQCKAK
jgi:hypothetical protein